MAYQPSKLEPKWQAYWLEQQTFRAEIDTSKPKYYVLDMFPYPSGDGLHAGHPEGYTATDILARYKRMRGFNVLHPMGWDAFGLPAEQYAIKTGTQPRTTTQNNIANFKRQIRSLGFSYDWSRELDTTDPRYVRWTQWIFSQLYARGLAYIAEVPVNWCPALGTVLANEEVTNGKSEIGDHPVERVPMRQWMLKITEYADRLIEDLDDLDWPESVKTMQREWIGRSEGARVSFPVAGAGNHSIEIFTTRPDTLFGATYMVLAPEHPLVDTITTESQRAEVSAYVEAAARKSERNRLNEGREKTGTFTGATAINPVNGAEISVWIADYVLASYGTGAIMAVPGHDQRDWDFARAFDLPVIEVVSGGDITQEAHSGKGLAVNSGFLDGLDRQAAQTRMNEWLTEQGIGNSEVTYKLRDWLFSRQRYWGEPFPIVHRSDGGQELLPDAELPLLLPELEDFRPSGDFEPPLARVRDWIETADAAGAPALRDANTMPQWAGSCWYFLRFIDPDNDDAAWSEEAERYWMPVDLYVGGAEHAVLHLLYSRFWHKVFYDLGLVHTKEPFQKLVNQGMILGESFRYFDDNLEDEADKQPELFSSADVVFTDDGPIATSTQSAVKARFVPTKDVRFNDKEVPRHPERDDILLDVVIEKMSKSRGNVVNPDDVVDEFGGDTMRLYEMFIGPLEKAALWSTDGIHGIYRFLQKAWRLLIEEDADGNESLRKLAEGAGSQAQAKLTAQTIAGVTEDFEAMRFNTAISKLMVLVRDIGKTGGLIPRDSANSFVLLLSPMAPHIGEELWARLGHENTLAYEPWPTADPALLVEDEIALVIQVNGKRRAEIRVAADASKDSIEAQALACEAVARHLDGRAPKKVIVVPGRLVNVVG